ncbi:MAG: nitroreductase family protein [Oscillospiraceae bacterium]|nr:nitroreductase family protein [Oscillospiraceae bacterium]
MDFLPLAAERYSSRKFEDRPVPQEAVDKILAAASLAPTAHNNQPQEIIVVQSPEALALLRKCTECHFGAPLAFIISYDRDRAWKRSYDGKDSGDVDASIVTTHMMLEAADLGLGSCWVMDFIPEAVRAEFELPDNLEPVAILPAGYPAGGPSPIHGKKRPVEGYVTYR